MFSLGWEEGVRRRGGGEGRGFGRRSWWRSVDFYLTILFCSVMFLTGGFGTPTIEGGYMVRGAYQLLTS